MYYKNKIDSRVQLYFLAITLLSVVAYIIFRVNINQYNDNDLLLLLGPLLFIVLNYPLSFDLNKQLTPRLFLYPTILLLIGVFTDSMLLSAMAWTWAVYQCLNQILTDKIETKWYLLILYSFPFLKIDFGFIAWHMRVFSSKLTMLFFQYSGLYDSHLLSPTEIKINSLELHVVPACSGIDNLSLILTLCSVAIFIHFKNKWIILFNTLLCIIAIIAANVIRLISTGIIGLEFGLQYCEGIYHQISGIAVMILAIVFILLIIKLELFCYQKLKKNM